MSERQELLRDIVTLEREIRSLQGLIETTTAEAVTAARKRNADLKAKVLEAQKALANELVDRKTPREASGLEQYLSTLKAEALAYCADRNIEPSIWKKLESL